MPTLDCLNFPPTFEYVYLGEPTHQDRANDTRIGGGGVLHRRIR